MQLALDAKEKIKKPCFNMRDFGSCKNGDRCEWSHDKALVDEARKEKKEKEKADQITAAGSEKKEEALEGDRQRKTEKPGTKQREKGRKGRRKRQSHL